MMAAPTLRSAPSPDAVSVRSAVPLVGGDALLALVDSEYGDDVHHSVELVGLAPLVPDEVPDHSILGEITSLPVPVVAFAALASPPLAARIGAELIGQPETVAYGLPSDVGTVRCAVGGRWLVELARWSEDDQGDELERLRPATAHLGYPSGRRDFVRGVSIVTRELAAPTSALVWAQTSLGELRERRCRPDELDTDPGSFAADLGRSIGEFHGAMATGAGAAPLDVETFVSQQLSRLRQYSLDEVFIRRVQRSLERLAHAEDLGGQIEIHGSLALSEIVNAGGEWALLGGDPRSRVDSPLSDLASLIAALHLAADEALGDRKSVV